MTTIDDEGEMISMVAASGDDKVALVAMVMTGWWY